MAKKTARQLDREIASALSRRGHHSGQAHQPWWIWQLSGTPRVLKKVELPWAYSWKDVGGESTSRDHLMNLGYKDVSKLRVVPRRFGSMRVVEVTKSGVHQMFTPPLYLFADLKKIDPAADLTDIGSSRFWIQPEIFQATSGEIYQGDHVRELYDVDREELSKAPDQRAVNDVLVALDAYLTSGRPDARFI